MRFLFAWEQGGRLGHLSILLIIARILRGHGHEILFMVKDVCSASGFLDAEGFSYTQAPHPAGFPGARREAASFADILAQAGFGNAQLLGGMVKGWQTVFTLYRPDAVLAQYAPIATFTADLLGIPCLKLGTGFESPPEAAPYPSFRPWLKLSRENLLKTENNLLDNANKIRKDFAVTPLSYLHQAIKADLSLLCSLPELDHYQNRKNGRYIGPLFICDEGEEVRWPGCREQNIFVYLVPGSETALILEALNNSGAAVIAFIPGIDADLKKRHEGKNIRISSEKIRLSGLLAEMTLAITNANIGTLSATLLSGVPSICIPTHIEQLLCSYNMERIGAGIMLKREQLKTGFEDALCRMFSDGGFREKAGSVAAKYAPYDQESVINRIVNTLVRMGKWCLTRENWL